jgi:hypothetical protein
MTKVTRILIDSGSTNRILDCEALLKHLAVCLRGIEVRGVATIHLDPDGRVFVNGQQVYQPPRRSGRAAVEEWHKSRDESKTIYMEK